MGSIIHKLESYEIMGACFDPKLEYERIVV